MANTATGDSERSNQLAMAGYKTHVIVDDSAEMKPLLWLSVKDALIRFVNKTPFELNLINNGIQMQVENRAELVRLLEGVVLHGRRNLLDKLDAVVDTEVAEIQGLSPQDLQHRPKLNIIMVLYDLPTDPEPRSLAGSVQHIAESLHDAELLMDRIRLHFVQVGHLRRLSTTLEIIKTQSSHFDYTVYTGSRDIWKILLDGNPGVVLAPAPHFHVPSRPASHAGSHPVSFLGASNLPISPRALDHRALDNEGSFQALQTPMAEHGPAPPGSEPVFQLPAYLRDGSMQTTDTYHLNAGFTISGWILQRDRAESSPHEFLTFHSGELAVLRASVGEGHRNAGIVTIVFPGVSANPTANEFPIGVWTFFCAVYDGSSVRLGFGAQLGPRAFLSRIQFDRIIIGLYTSNSSPSLSLAKVKVYDRVLSVNEIQNDYFDQSPSVSALSHHSNLI